jgi:hypothetical protein
MRNVILSAAKDPMAGPQILRCAQDDIPGPDRYLSLNQTAEPPPGDSAVDDTFSLGYRSTHTQPFCELSTALTMNCKPRRPS